MEIHLISMVVEVAAAHGVQILAAPRGAVQVGMAILPAKSIGFNYEVNGGKK